MLVILKKHGVGSNIVRVLRNFWDKLPVAAQQNGHHSDPFRESRGVTQGDVVSPTIFNVVADATVWHWFQCTMLDADQGDSDLSEPEIAASFCANGGVTAGCDHEQIQSGFDLAMELFERVGLKSNVTKTKAVVCRGGSAQSQISSPARKCWFEGDPTCSMRKRRRALCNKCGKSMQECHLPNHLLRQHSTCQDVSAAGSAATSTGQAPAHWAVSTLGRRMNVECPAPGCLGRALDRCSPRQHCDAIFCSVGGVLDLRQFNNRTFTSLSG
jgi:hypothetical protein